MKLAPVKWWLQRLDPVKWWLSLTCISTKQRGRAPSGINFLFNWGWGAMPCFRTAREQTPARSFFFFRNGTIMFNFQEKISQLACRGWPHLTRCHGNPDFFVMTKVSGLEWPNCKRVYWESTDVYFKTLGPTSSDYHLTVSISRSQTQS